MQQRAASARRRPSPHAPGLPGAQEALLDQLLNTGKPVALLLMNGRPLAIPSVLNKAPAVLETWFLGTEHDSAVADVLFGDVSPASRAARASSHRDDSAVTPSRRLTRAVARPR